MGIRFHCSTCGHKLNVKAFQAGRRGLCPYCGASIQIPSESTRPSSKELRRQRKAGGEGDAVELAPDPGPIGSPSGPGVNGPGGASSGPAPAPRVVPAGGAPANPAPTAIPRQVPGQPAASPAPFSNPNRNTPFEPAGPDAAQPYPAPSLMPMQSPGPSSPPADPLSEAPDAVWYVRPPSGGQYGPAAAEVMRGWLDEGRVSPDSLVWREGWRDWQQAGQVFVQLGAGQLDPQLGAIAAGVPASPDRGAGASRRSPRSRSTALNAVVITVLVLAVIVLLIVFIWVLNRRPAGEGAPSGESAAAVEAQSTGPTSGPLLRATLPHFAP